MTRALALLAAVLLGLGAGACGGAGKGAGSAPGAADNGVVTYGHAASAADRLAVTALVERYYAAAAAQDSARACSLTYYILVETMPEQYGQPPGPLYLRGAKTCRAVLSIVFKRFHTQLTEPPEVTGVRVEGDLAYALLGWATMPVGFMEVRREGGAWKIDRVLAAPLP
jgi:hypothetical protein